MNNNKYVAEFERIKQIIGNTCFHPQVKHVFYLDTVHGKGRRTRTRNNNNKSDKKETFNIFF